MTGLTEKKTGNYLLLHRSGAVAKTKTLTASEPVEGITTIINLETLEQFNGEYWEKIPDGYATLIAAEDILYEEENEDDEDDEDPGTIQLGAKRYINPYLVWAYCKNNFKRSKI